MTGAGDQTHKTENVRAAQYVRMSTEHQKYSTENQAIEIAKYARENGYVIVKTYMDSGKSGLKLDGRDALQSLIEDVSNGQTDFSIILVYDVSRWGRFQNADESAYLEYLCTRAGIAVEYCAEQFANDGSLTTTIIKNMKRAMAGEYSRDLSRKVFEGQRHLVELGYRQGGAAGFGLRRQLIDERGEPKALLAHGERKSIQTDRVILVPGPATEVAVVDRIYRLFVEKGQNECSIAGILNYENLFTDMGRPWTRGTVHQVLTNEKYVGNNVFNRISFKLKMHRVRNPPDAIIRASGVFQPIVSEDLFQRAAAIIAKRTVRLRDDEMLALLTQLLLKSGKLSAIIIDEQEGMPSSSIYGSRFGSLLRAYKLIGYTPDRDYRYVEINRLLRTLFPDVVSGIIASVENAGGRIVRDAATDLLKVNGEFAVSVVVCRCIDTPAGSLRWKIRLDNGLHPDLSIAVRMAPGNEKILDYYLLPAIDFASANLAVAEDNPIGIDAYRCADLSRFIRLTERVPIRRAA